MKFWNSPGRRFLLILPVVVIISILVIASIYLLALPKSAPPITTKPTQTPLVMPTSGFTPTVGGTPTPAPPIRPETVLGINTNSANSYPGIPWVRVSYPTCGGGNLKGDVLKSAIQNYHNQSVHVLLLICQPGPAQLYNTSLLNDGAQAGADAVQCGNEEMKYDPGLTNYVPPANFAKYFDLCQHAVHAVNPGVPAILGALDPHVGGIDYQPLQDQVSYLDQMQQAMNTQVHPGGNWSWRSQIVGLIDSWHNGYPSQSTNSLYHLFVFWSQQFHVDLNSGQLGHHLWVVEGTACNKGCGIDPSNAYQVAVVHILSLVTNVQTAMRYHVPFFYFSAMDFNQTGNFRPVGVLDTHGHSKPLRQDLPMGARTLTLSCASGKVVVADQEKLLARLYSGCTLPGNYTSILAS